MGGNSVAQAMESLGGQAIKESSRYAARTGVTEISELGARALSKEGGKYVLTKGGEQVVINTAATSAAVTSASAGAAAASGLVPGLVGCGMEIAVKQVGGSGEAA